MDCIEETGPESPRKMQDVQVVVSETSWNATRGKEEDGWRLEPEGETETPGRHERVQVKSSQKGKRSARERSFPGGIRRKHRIT